MTSAESIQLPQATRGHPLVGVLAMIGSIVAWAVFVVVIVAAKNLVRNNPPSFFGPTAEQKSTLATLDIVSWGAVGLAALSFFAGLFATLQQTRSRVTGVIGLVASSLLLILMLLMILQA